MPAIIRFSLPAILLAVIAYEGCLAFKSWLKTRPDFSTIAVCADNHSLDLEHAESLWQRIWGLSRISKPEKDGMLFSYSSIQVAGEDGFWMQRTTFPLTVAFINEQGVIIGKEDMLPCPPLERCPTHHSKGDYSKAIELETSTFNSLNLEIGSSITIGRCESTH